MQTVNRLFGMLKNYWKTLLLSVTLLTAHVGLGLVPPLLEKQIIDNVVAAQDRSGVGLSTLVGLLVAVYALARLAGAGDGYVRHVWGQRFILDLRVRLYAYLQRLSLAFFERTSTGELMSRVTNDVNALEQFVTHGLPLISVDLLRLVGAIAILVVLNGRLALFTFLPVPVLAITLRFYNTRIRPIYRHARDRLGDINARLQDSLSGIQVIQAFGQEHRELERFAVESENYYRAQVRGIRYWSTLLPAITFVFLMGRVIVLGAGAAMVLKGELSLGSLVAFLSYIHMVYGPVERLVETDNVFQQAIAAGERVFELLDEKPEIKDASDAIELPPIRGNVVFDKVQFFYGTGDVVLHEVSFHINPGEVVALVGPSGAGKTSIANLLCRFYDPIHGQITVDGHDLRQVKLASLRKQLAVVLQDTFLFNSTIRENLLYGKPDATEEQLVSAARAAYAHDFIKNLPNGYDTEIGERGVRLSGGQKQRLALARALLTNPRILILDEATSSVDAEAEFLIQKALESVLEGRTALIIAHRLSTVRNADKIIALEGGKVIEIGDHRELMHRGGLYSQLYHRQLELAEVS
jgi:ABC-type multidrug transport system fused ATPase/permease subunit